MHSTLSHLTDLKLLPSTIKHIANLHRDCLAGYPFIFLRCHKMMMMKKQFTMTMNKTATYIIDKAGNAETLSCLDVVWG